MIHYLPYGIFISADPLGPILARFKTVTDPVKRAQMETFLKDTRKTSGWWRPDPITYETRVRVLLDATVKTSTGTVLLTSLKRSIPLWIVPYRAGGHNALTGQMTSELTEGIRIQFSPDEWAVDTSTGEKYQPGFSPIETLFHELVHGSRISNVGSAGLNKTPLENMGDYEEFLADMMTNVLRSEWRRKEFQRDHRTGSSADQSEMERLLRSKPAYMKALEYFLTDPFVQKVARLPFAFNPFRDLGRLKAPGSPVPGSPTPGPRVPAR
jgi:hypothetical protein